MLVIYVTLIIYSTDKNNVFVKKSGERFIVQLTIKIAVSQFHEFVTACSKDQKHFYTPKTYGLGAILESLCPSRPDQIFSI